MPREQTGFKNTFPSSKRWCATFSPLWSRLARTQVKLSYSLLNPSPDSCTLVSNTAPPLLHTASPAAPWAKNTRLKPSEGHSSFYGQRRLADGCWSLTLPPSTDQDPLSAWKTVWLVGMRGRWRKPGRGSEAGDSGSGGHWGVDLGPISPAKHLFMATLLSELCLLTERTTCHC